MALFAVTSDFAGKTLRQIGEEISAQGGYIPRMDQIARAFGISEDTPLKLGQSATVPDDQGSGEYQFLSQRFKETTEAELYAEQLTKAAKERIDAETAWVDKYLKDNPFVFDEELARKSATAEYAPYYTEILDDYLKDVGKMRESTQDEQKLLRTLRTLDVGARSRAYEYAVENANEGYEGKGLFSSGLRARDVGRQEIGYKAGMQEAEERYAKGEADIDRTLEGYSTDEFRKTRDIGRAQEASILGGIEQRRGEAIKPYLSTYEQAYKRQFQPGTMGAGDYLPSDYLRY